jgi:peptide deformylase
VPRILPIVQLGDPVLRARARDIAPAALAEPKMKQLIDAMRETMRDAPGVGLAAPQIGLGMRLAVIEDRPETVEGLDPESRAERERDAVPFHVIVNPVLTVEDATPAYFVEGCLSLAGFVAVVGRALGVRVECLDETGRERVIHARGWYARILQHEIDHLNGIVYVDRMETRTFMDGEEFARHWADADVVEMRKVLEAERRPTG